MSEGIFGWLVTEEELEQVSEEKIDVGGEGGFVRSTIAEYIFSTRWGVTNTTIQEQQASDEGLHYDFVRTTRSGDKFAYYCDLREAADMIHSYSKSMQDNPFGPELYLTMTADLDTIVGWGSDEKSPHDVYDTGLFFFCEMKTWSQGYKNHKANLVFVPSLVQAIALAEGILDEPIYNYRELARQPLESIVDMCEDLYGIPAPPIEATWRDIPPILQRGRSDLLEARKKLWLALGADGDNPEFWKGRKPGDKGIPSNSPIGKLLGAIMSQNVGGKPWKMKMVAEVSSMFNPILPSTHHDSGEPLSSGLRTYALGENGEILIDEETGEFVTVLNEEAAGSSFNRIPVVLKVWKSLDDAAAESESQTSVSYPEIPEQWNGITPKELISSAKKILSDENLDLSDLDGPTPKRKKFLDEFSDKMSMNEEEIDTWKEYFA